MRFRCARAARENVNKRRQEYDSTSTVTHVIFNQN